MSWFVSHQGLPNLRIWAEFIFWLLPPYFENVWFLGTAALKQERTDKLTPTFRAGHFYILYKTGIRVLDLVESLSDVQYKKLFPCEKNYGEKWSGWGPGVNTTTCRVMWSCEQPFQTEDDPEEELLQRPLEPARSTLEPRTNTTIKRWPVRIRMQPFRHKDFVMS